MSITVLTHPTVLLAKTWNVDGSITPYTNAKYFKARSAPLTNFDELASLLKKLENSPRSCIIRGAYKGDEVAAADPEYKEGLVQRRLDFFDDEPEHALLLEIDDFEPISCDPVQDPEGAVKEFMGTLPVEFHDARCCWQLSNSAGHAKNAGKLKAHVWVWLETAYTAEHLKAWAKATSIPVDVSVLQPVQINYTAPPVFAEGVVDPVPVRSGQLPGRDVALTLPDSFLTPASTKVSKRQQLDNTIHSDPVAQRLFERGMVKSVDKVGALRVECPCCDRHTGESGETTTLYYPANTGGYVQGNFKCLHAHCSEEPQTDFLQALGFSAADDFEEVTPDLLPDLPTMTKAIRAVGPDRFKGIPCHLFAVDVVQQWLIKKILPAAQLIVMYGASGSGKSFVAIDMACAIARGIHWREFKVAKQGRVAYVCAEGAEGFRRRLRAYALHHDVPLEEIDVVVLPYAPNLLKGDDVRDLIRALHALGPLSLVVLDTLAVVTAGGNENSSEDMGLAISQARLISEVLHTTVMFVHHTGKDESKGARGHSSLRAAADCELEVARSGDARCISLGKQKDDDDNRECGFKLHILQVGVDEDGDPVTSCVVDHTLGSMAQIKRRNKKTGVNETLLLDAFNAICLNPDDGVAEGEVIDKAIEMKGTPENNKALLNMKTNFVRALKTMTHDKIFLSMGGMLTLFSEE